MYMTLPLQDDLEEPATNFTSSTIVRFTRSVSQVVSQLYQFYYSSVYSVRQSGSGQTLPVLL